MDKFEEAQRKFLEQEHIQNVMLDFKNQVCKNLETIDPEYEHDWTSLSIGYFIAKGLTINEAKNLAPIARYKYHYWNR